MLVVDVFQTLWCLGINGRMRLRNERHQRPGEQVLDRKRKEYNHPSRRPTSRPAFSSCAVHEKPRIPVGLAIAEGHVYAHVQMLAAKHDWKTLTAAP